MTKRPLRFLTVADVPPDPNSGAAGTVYHTNVALRELGHEVDEIWAKGLGPRRIAHGNLHSLLEQPRAYRREVLRAVARRQYDVVLMSQPQAYLAAQALKRGGFRGVVLNRSHGVELRADAILPEWHRRLGVPESRWPLQTSALRRLLARQWPAVVRWSDGVIVPCEDDRNCLLREIAVPPYQVRVIHHGVPEQNLATRRPYVSPADRYRRLLYVGQYSFIKGPDILVQVLNRVLAQRHDVTMTWVTSASAFERIRAGLAPEIRSRMFLQDWVTQRELIEVYDRHGVFLFPSLMEGAGKAVLEAMSRGLCVIASDTGGMRDYIESGVNGMLCPVGDDQAFVTATLRAIDDPVETTWQGQTAAEFTRQQTWRACAEGITRFIQDLSSTTKADGHTDGTVVSTRYNDWHAHRARAETGAADRDPKLATWHQMVLPRLGDIVGLKVAEIGCGRGDFSILLAERGAEVTALDFSPQAIDIARERSAARGVDIEWIVGDAQETGLPVGAFDLVISCECLEHVPDPQQMARELHRICRPGGRVLLTTPSYLNGMMIAWIHSWVTRRPYNSGSGVQPHENLFFWFTVKPMLRRAGFRIVDTDSRIFQFLLLPRVAPQKLRVDEFGRSWLNRLFRPFGLHYLYNLEKPAPVHPMPIARLLVAR